MAKRDRKRKRHPSSEPETAVAADDPATSSEPETAVAADDPATYPSEPETRVAADDPAACQQCKWFKKLSDKVRRAMPLENGEWTAVQLEAARKLFEKVTADSEPISDSEDQLQPISEDILQYHECRVAMALQSQRNEVQNMLMGKGHRAWMYHDAEFTDKDHEIQVGHNLFWQFNINNVDIQIGEAPDWKNMAKGVPKVMIVHRSGKLPDWLLLHMQLGGFFRMHEDYYASQGLKSECIGCKAWIEMEKRIYISPNMMRMYPKCSEALLYAVASTVSKAKLIKEEDKDKWIAQARCEGKHAKRYVWLLTREEHEHEVLKGLKNTWSFQRLLQDSRRIIRHVSVW